MPVLYKWYITYTLEEARTIVKIENCERAKTIHARLKEMRIQQWENSSMISKNHTMKYTDDPIEDIEKWFDNHLDIQYEKTKNALSQDLVNL